MLRRQMRQSVILITTTPRILHNSTSTSPPQNTRPNPLRVLLTLTTTTTRDLLVVNPLRRSPTAQFLLHHCSNTMDADKSSDSSPEQQHKLLWIFTRTLAFIAAVVLSYILYRVATGAYKQYSSGSNPFRWKKPRAFAGYQRLSRREEEVDFDEDEGYHDAESFEIERSPSQKPLPEPPLPEQSLSERPLPDKPLPPVPGAE
jgi:hypothetical protein